STLPLYLSRVHEMDYDQDGRSDLVFWNEDHFDVYRQAENGLFAPVAKTFVPDVPFDSEGVYSHAFEFRGQGLFSLLFGFGKKTKGTVLHSLRDLNGDGVADLVTLTLSGRSATKQRSVYEVHFGTAAAAGAAGADAPGGTVFAPQVGTVIRPRGKGGAMQPWGYSVQRFEDLDGDGRVESLFREVTVGLGGIARALVGNSVPINLELYRMEDSTYPEKPTFRRKIRRFAPFAGLGNVFFPPVLMGDVNGDGRSDLLVGESPQELHVFLGVPGPGLFARQPKKVAVALPSDERNTRLVDLNKDGKQDVLVHRGPTRHAPTEPHRVTLLIAR
ncbi:MAG: FG-GAP repeat domain-containing protein, partial [Thermoanaerobaculia bacterium]